ncbi:retrotransposon protein, putative, Ty3-gypsy sub-class [Panicum miliaceum]|uniref:Retrotransposon protein, putative, Ty3-gypsy sub-class n=1 Tax=Panicum miliaceum TaxID=4540 RepID=A0A3L6SIP2_PANMI|nr:retrotransposon protein, putative, Ty3-gypsy sub-class [Panicum miliaceum]
MWGRPASPRPAGLGMVPLGIVFHVDVPYRFLRNVGGKNHRNRPPTACTVISNRQRDRFENAVRDDSDRFPAFPENITSREYPRDFKPTNILKYDGKQDPQQWLRCYSVAIEKTLKQVFVENFQGSMISTGTRHDLSHVKQVENETLRSYTHCFFDTRATIANIVNEEVIRCIRTGLATKKTYREFGRNLPTIVIEL